jgi:hypothetical protein
MNDLTTKRQLGPLGDSFGQSTLRIPLWIWKLNREENSPPKAGFSGLMKI